VYEQKNNKSQSQLKIATGCLNIEDPLALRHILSDILPIFSLIYNIIGFCCCQ
jgi:hypothetical protein